MNENRTSNPALRSAGYAELVSRYGLEVIPNWHRSLVTTSGIQRINSTGGVIEEIYPSTYWPGDALGDHLEFALKYDGINLGILANLFQKISGDEFLNYILSKPTGKYARRLWFLYEFLTDTTLPVKDLETGNYIDLLDSDQYYTSTPAHRVRRQRINDNLMGDRRFCPIVRRTDLLQKFEKSDFPARCRKVLSGFSKELLERALRYLYTKETKSSFEIENITPSATRTERFVMLLRLAEREDFCEKIKLIDLQNRVVDPRFCDLDYRTTQNYVGQTVAWRRERIHFVCPKPEDLPELMDGLIAAHRRMDEGGVSPAIHAATVAFGFVFLHPFEDGNGRIHRFLIHNILARQGFTPEGIMFPISASMLRNLVEYNASLEAFSQSLMTLVDYSLDEEGRMTVHNETALWYRYIDLTPQSEALFRFIEQTIKTDLVEELTFLENYDKTKTAIQSIVDLPDHQIDLFIRFCLQNNGRLSNIKRASHFRALSDDEIAGMEQALRSFYMKHRANDPRL